MTEPGWNSRYLAYCRSQGRTPEQQREWDWQESPGAVMMNFSLWIQDRWWEWRKMRGYPGSQIMTHGDHLAFDKWLEETRS